MDWLYVLQFVWVVQAVRSALVWNTGGQAGLFVSIAVPIDLPSRHVFLSYNFEALYRLPKTWRKNPRTIHRANSTNEQQLDDFKHYVDYGELEHSPPKWKPSGHKKPRPTHHKPKPTKHRKKHKPKPGTRPSPKPPPDEDYKDFFEDAWARKKQEESLLSRTKLYKILSHRFEQHGFGRGDICLLRLICEVSSAQLGVNNGVLGSLMQVIFTPSHSEYEALPQRYYDAEIQGKSDDCRIYSEKCEKSVLDLISRPLKDFIGNKKT